MKFINNGIPIKIRIGNLVNCVWKTLENGETIDLPENIGFKLKLKKVTGNQELPKVTEGQIGDKVVETKQIETDKTTDKQTDGVLEDYTPDDTFFKELKSIKGIGKKTAEDIVTWGTKEKLLEQINLKADLPFRDDIVRLLRKQYG